MPSASSTRHSGPGKDSLDGRGEPVTLDGLGPRYIYYRLYTKHGSITSHNPIYANDPYISRTLPKLITPPLTASSVKKHLCKIEGLSRASTSTTLFESLSSQTAVEETSRLSLRGSTGPGLFEDDPIVLVVEAQQRLPRTVSLEGLPEARHANSRYVYYRLYDEEGAVASKTSFDLEDFSLGRINMLSVAPPQTVAVLKSRVMGAENLIGHNIQLFKDIDGEVPMNDHDAISHPQAYNYPGYVADEPITIICRTQESQTKVEEIEMWVQIPSRNPVPPRNSVPPRPPRNTAVPPRPSRNTAVPPRPSRNTVPPRPPQNSLLPQSPVPPRNPVPLVDARLPMPIKASRNWEPLWGGSDWLSFKKDEIMYTDGLETGYSVFGEYHPGYNAINNYGKRGFVHKKHVDFC